MQKKTETRVEFACRHINGFFEVTTKMEQYILISGLSKNKDPEKALEFANATGAFVASQNGAVPEYSEKQIEKIINSVK